MDAIIDKAVEHLVNGDSIIYPTETLWALGCDATNENAVQKLSDIKGRESGKGFVLLVDGLEMLSQYVGHITSTLRSIASSNKPTTVVFSEHQLLPPNVLASDHSVAIRITQSTFCKTLIREFGRPIVASSANFKDKLPPRNYKEIDQKILDEVQFVIILEQSEPMTNEASRIVKLSPGGDIVTIR